MSAQGFRWLCSCHASTDVLHIFPPHRGAASWDAGISTKRARDHSTGAARPKRKVESPSASLRRRLHCCFHPSHVSLPTRLVSRCSAAGGCVGRHALRAPLLHFRRAHASCHSPLVSLTALGVHMFGSQRRGIVRRDQLTSCISSLANTCPGAQHLAAPYTKCPNMPDIARVGFGFAES